MALPKIRNTGCSIRQASADALDPMRPQLSLKSARRKAKQSKTKLKDPLFLFNNGGFRAAIEGESQRDSDFVEEGCEDRGEFLQERLVQSQAYQKPMIILPTLFFPFQS
ncbi:hypothetical protein V6N13_046704 [Hibiscus sabdariffa]